MMRSCSAVALALAVVAAIGGTAPGAQGEPSGAPDPVLTGVLKDESGRPLAHADVQACSATICLYGETAADGRFRFELPRRAAPFVLKTPEDLSATPRRAAMLAPAPLPSRGALDLRSVYVPTLPAGRALRTDDDGVQRVEAGDGLELQVRYRELVPPPGKAVVGIAARRMPSAHIPRYVLPAGEQVVAVYALHPFGTTSRVPVAVAATAALTPGTPVRFRTIREIDGTFSAPIAGRVSATRIETDATGGIVELTHLVITRLR
jgi:hypothetical protein